MLNHNGGVKTKQQMAEEYGVCRKTFNRLLKKQHVKIDRGLILPKDQVLIYQKLGKPLNEEVSSPNHRN